MGISFILQIFGLKPKYCTNKNDDGARGKDKGIIHPLGTLNVCTKFLAIYQIVVEICISVWTKVMSNRQTGRHCHTSSTQQAYVTHNYGILVNAQM